MLQLLWESLASVATVCFAKETVSDWTSTTLDELQATTSCDRCRNEMLPKGCRLEQHFANTPARRRGARRLAGTRSNSLLRYLYLL